MLYNIWFNGELISTEVSFMDAQLYLSQYCLVVREENEHMDEDNAYIVDLYCEEA